MKIFNTIIFILVMVNLSFGQQAKKQREENRLMEISKEWAQSAQTTDAMRTLSYWAQDAVLYTPDQGTFKGHQELSQMLAGAAQIPGFAVNWVPKSVRVSESGDMGYVISHKEFKLPDNTGKIQSYFFVDVGIWEKQADGSWKNTVDIYNPNKGITSLD